MKSLLAAIILVFIFSFLGYGQKKPPVKIALINEATAVPFYRIINTPIHPGLQVGTEFEWKESRTLRLYPAVNIGYMFHKRLFQGVYVNAELGFDLTFNFGLNLKSTVGLGYMHTFATQEEFQFKDGQYKRGWDRGNPRIIPSFGVGFGYRVNPKKTKSAEVFVMYQGWLEYPYSPGFIPLMSHTNLLIGSKFYPFKN